MIDGPSRTCGPWQEGPHGRFKRCRPNPNPDAAIVARMKAAVMRRIAETTHLTKAENATARRLIAEALGAER